MGILPIKFETDLFRNTKVIAVCDNKRHLVCLPYSIENLHFIARVFGIKKHWFHKNHYDIPKSKIQEVMDCAKVVSSKEIVKIIKKKNENIKNS